MTMAVGDNSHAAARAAAMDRELKRMAALEAMSQLQP